MREAEEGIGTFTRKGPEAREQCTWETPSGPGGLRVTWKGTVAGFSGVKQGIFARSGLEISDGHV